MVAPALAQSDDDLTALGRQVRQLQGAGKYGEAVAPAERAVLLATRQYGPDHPIVGTALHDLANSYQGQGRFTDAEPLYKRALGIREKVLGFDHSDVAASLSRLASLYVAQGRLVEAEPLYQRALAIYEGRGSDQRNVGATLGNLATLYYAQARYADAEALYKRAIPMLEKALGPHHSGVGTALNNLAAIYERQRRGSEAEALYIRALSIREKAFGPDHPFVATALNNLAALHYARDRNAEAEPLYRRALAIYERSLGPDHPNVGIALDNLARIAFSRSDWAGAVSLWQRSTELVVRRSKRGTDMLGRELTGKNKSEAEMAGERFLGISKAAYRLAAADPSRAAELAAAMFQTAQWAKSSQAATSLAQMAVRQAKGDGALARLVRERQDLVEEWQDKDKIVVAARSEPPARRNAGAEAELSTRIAAIDDRIAQIDRTLAEDFPDYSALAGPEPLTVSQVQSLLSADEALLLFLDTPDWEQVPEETFIWVVTKTDTRWVRSEHGAKALADQVAALRCGLDQAAWEANGAARCAGLLGGEYQTNDASAGKPLPFDVARAHALYQSLFGQLEDLVVGKHLLIVPSGPLTALPFQVLVTTNPTAVSDHAAAVWLAKRHAITTLPSIASLKGLRQLARASRATQPFIGFGNPLLTGPLDADRRAWERQACPNVAPRLARTARRGAQTPFSRFFGSGKLADIELVRRQFPLPETADELCAVARSIGAPETAVHLGEKASETAAKALSASGALADARIVHFATHGLVASQSGMVGVAKGEPALILTPPDRPTEEDDGLLTASEVAQLRLDADWVVLSACNTAAGGGDFDSEALSGLARAFFYAGARSLLVSHWAVDSQATVSLVAKAFDAIKTDPRVGHAEALRRSMLALMSSGGNNSHPATWAPFVVVGEGGGQNRELQATSPGTQSPAPQAARRKPSVAKKAPAAKKSDAQDWRVQIFRP